MTAKYFDFIIIGSGLAGLFASLNAAKYGTVALIFKTDLKVSNSYLAQGGVAAAISEHDSSYLHIQDTLKAGRELCDREAVEILVHEGKEIVESLIDGGMKFDSLNEDILFGLEGGHSTRRILHSNGDSTGAALVNFIFSEAVKNKNIQFFENFYAFKLLNDGLKCTGAACLNLLSKETVLFTGSNIIIASGGVSAIYPRSTNPDSTTGEGISLAYEIGAEIESMEFIQFHPTSFYSDSGETFLISEAVRGEGARLVDWKGERFLKRWDADELSPRDKVAEAMYNELKESGRPNLFLRLDHLNPSSVKERFRFIYKTALKYNVDITKDPVPVSPAAHYTIGGIKTDMFGATNISNLYAVGEAASTNVHGANRLASNSLLECLVFAKRAVEHSTINPASSITGTKMINPISFDARNYNQNLRIKEKVGKLLWEYAGIVRSQEGLRRAKSILSDFEDQVNSKKDEYFLQNGASIVLCAKLITESALMRKESRGCSIRSDFSASLAKFNATIILKKNAAPRFQEMNTKLEIKCV